MPIYTIVFVLAVASGVIAWQSYWLREQAKENRKKAEAERTFLLELAVCIQKISNKL